MAAATVNCGGLTKHWKYKRNRRWTALNCWGEINDSHWIVLRIIGRHATESIFEDETLNSAGGENLDNYLVVKGVEVHGGYASETIIRDVRSPVTLS